MPSQELEVWHDNYPLFTMAVMEEALPTRDINKIANALAVMERLYPDLAKKTGFSIAHDWPVCPTYEPQIPSDDTIRIEQLR